MLTDINETFDTEFPDIEHTISKKPYKKNMDNLEIQPVDVTKNSIDSKLSYNKPSIWKIPYKRKPDYCYFC